MRNRALIAIVFLLLPSGLSAQRIPLPGIRGRNPGRPGELPPQPEPIARQSAYRRWRLAVESYPMVSYFQSAGVTGSKLASSWSSLGAGTRADYLLTRNLSATLDMTSSLIGGPVTNTVELGTRLHPEWAEHKLYPYVDLRVGYIAVYDRSLGAYNDIYAPPLSQTGTVVRYSRGFGAIGGAGVEYALTRSWSLTTGAALLQSELRARDFDAPPVHPQFGLTSFRYTLGVRYNPVRLMRSPGSDTR